MARSLTDRMMGAATLDVDTFEEVEHDADATLQAAAIVALVAAAQAAVVLQAGPLGMARAAGSQLVGVGLWCAITYLIGTRLFSGTATVGEVFRTVGFAFSPQVLILIALLPFIGGLVELFLAPVLTVWVLVAVVVGVRQALDVSTTRAVLASAMGAVAYIVLVAVVPGL